MLKVSDLPRPSSSKTKAVVVRIASNGFTLADPNDRGMLDVVGFDTSVPAVIWTLCGQRGPHACPPVQGCKITRQAEAKAPPTSLNFSFPGKEKYMNTLAPLFIVLAMLIATVVLLKIGRIRQSQIVSEGYVGLLLQSLSTAQNAGNTLVLGLPGFVPLKNGKAGSCEHQAEDGAS